MNLKKLTSSGIPGNMPYPLNSFSAIENLVRLTDYPFNVHNIKMPSVRRKNCPNYTVHHVFFKC